MPGPVAGLGTGGYDREQPYTGGKLDGKRGGKDGAPNQMHSESDKLRKMFYSGLRAYEKKPLDKSPNPVWLSYNERCQHSVTTAKQLRKLLDYYSHSDEVMVVRYHRDGCVSCNALDKVMEFSCRDFKKHAPGLHFYDINAGDDPAMVEGMRRFPQLKAFNSGNWQDIEFKPPQDFRDSVMRSVSNEVDERAKSGEPVTAIQAEEMYFSVCAPAMSQVIEDALWSYYNGARVRIHNYWKQVSIRRTWYYKKFIEPSVDPSQSAMMRDSSIFGEMRDSEMKNAMEREELDNEEMARRMATAQPASSASATLRPTLSGM